MASKNGREFTLSYWEKNAFKFKLLFIHDLLCILLNKYAVLEMNIWTFKAGFVFIAPNLKKLPELHNLWHPKLQIITYTVEKITAALLIEMLNHL